MSILKKGRFQPQPTRTKSQDAPRPSPLHLPSPALSKGQQLLPSRSTAMIAMQSSSILHPHKYTLVIMVFLWAILVGFRPRPASLPQLATEAKLILHGTVISKTCLDDPQNGIYTKIKIRVRELWKGSHAEPHITVVHSGGILGNRQTKVSGQVHYQLGEEVVVFLDLNHRGEAVTLGMKLGKIPVTTGPETSKQQAPESRMAHLHGHKVPLATLKALVLP